MSRVSAAALICLALLVAVTPAHAGDAQDDAALGVLRLEDLGADWFEASGAAANSNATAANALGTAQALDQSPEQVLLFGRNERAVNVCPALREAAKQGTSLPILKSPVFRVAGVQTEDQLATLSYQNSVTTFPTRRAAQRYFTQLRTPGAARCVKAEWRRGFEVLTEKTMSQLGDSKFVSDALDHTEFKVERTHSPISVGFFGSYTTTLPEPSHFVGGALRVDYVLIGRYVVTYVVGNGRGSSTGDGDPGITQEQVEVYDQQMNVAAQHANDRLRAASDSP
jgi:hypothetical protein